MQGFVNRAIQCFICDTYGRAVWQSAARRAELGFSNFEAMLDYDAHLTDRVVSAVEAELGKPRDIFLEDLGTYLVTHPNMESLRRLLRFGGEDFEDFILSLDELPERAKLVLSEIELPSITLEVIGAKQYEIVFGPQLSGFSRVMMGTLRAMADDYGALAFIEHANSHRGEAIAITLADDTFAQGRNFELAPVQYATG
jgi:hypothetical protein